MGPTRNHHDTMSVVGRLWRRRREHPWFVAGALFVGVFFLVYPVVDWQLRAAGVAPDFQFWDFGAYTGAINRWEAGESLYLAENGSYHGSYIYPPVFLLLVRPFTVLFDSFRHAAMAWEAASVAVLWLGAQAAIRAGGVDLEGWERGLLLWLLVGFQPVLLAMKMGQLSPFFAGLLCFALAGVLTDGTRTESLAAGAFTAVPAAIKLPYAPAGAHLLQDRNRFAGAVLAGLGLVAVSLLVFGVDPHLTFLDVLRWGIEGGSSSRHPSLWLPPYYRPFYVVSTVSLPIPVDLTLLFRLGIAGLISALALLARNGDAEPETFALGVAAIPLLAPRTYAYYLAVVLPVAGVLIARELERDGYPLVPVVGLFLTSVHSYGLKLMVDHLPQWSSALTVVRELSPWLQPGLWGNLLLVGLALVRVAEVASTPSWTQRDDAIGE
jgi:alpha-1,2-mannosyltransferase